MGAEKARESASKTIKEVREIIGFRKFYWKKCRLESAFFLSF
jgi:delta 1-pyrroline-5-carboxylate dehydrogenase